MANFRRWIDSVLSLPRRVPWQEVPARFGLGPSPAVGRTGLPGVMAAAHGAQSGDEESRQAQEMGKAVPWAASKN